MREETNNNPNNWDKFIKYKEKQSENREIKRKHRVAIAAKYKWLTENLLAEELERKINNYYWSSKKHLLDFGGRQHVDVIGEPKIGDHLVFIEIEGGQTRPISNVAKIWRHVEEGKLAEPILLIQIFSPYYAESEGVHNTRMKESIFVGEQSNKATNKIKYKWLEPDKFPSNKDKLDNLIQEILSLIKDWERTIR